MENDSELLAMNNDLITIINAINQYHFFFRQNYMFWTDVHLKMVVRSRLDGSEVTVLVEEGLTSPGMSIQGGKCKLDEHACLQQSLLSYEQLSSLLSCLFLHYIIIIINLTLIFTRWTCLGLAQQQTVLD